MRHFVGFETPYNVKECVHVAQMGEEFISQSLAGRCALCYAGDIDDLNCGRNDFLSFDELMDRFESLIWDFGDPDVGFGGGLAIGGGLGAGGGEGVENGGLADEGQADDSDL